LERTEKIEDTREREWANNRQRREQARGKNKDEIECTRRREIKNEREKN
jgi:hypothetical protein